MSDRVSRFHSTSEEYFAIHLFSPHNRERHRYRVTMTTSITGILAKDNEGRGHVLTFFTSPSLSPRLFFLFSPDTSAVSRPKPSPRASAGVGKVKGLGKTALLKLPVLPESYHSLKKLLGLGSRSLFMYRLGRADRGVSMLFLFSLYASRFWFDVGGGGRANGFGGPVAPADMTAEALGDGGGRTM